MLTLIKYNLIQLHNENNCNNNQFSSLLFIT